VVADLLRTVRVLVRELVAARNVPPVSQDARRETEGVLPTNPTRQAVLAVLAQAEKPLKQEAIARRAGKRYGPYFRTCCAALGREGLIVEVDGGWKLAEPADDASARKEAAR
jgi:hypothetical protein